MQSQNDTDYLNYDHVVRTKPFPHPPVASAKYVSSAKAVPVVPVVPIVHVVPPVSAESSSDFELDDLQVESSEELSKEPGSAEQLSEEDFVIFMAKSEGVPKETNRWCSICLGRICSFCSCDGECLPPPCDLLTEQLKVLTGMVIMGLVMFLIIWCFFY